MAEVVLAGRLHVASCFALEGEVAAAIVAGTITTPAEIDLAFA
jgi:hypothetical protein